MKNLFRLFVLATATLFAAGCATSSDMQKLQSQISDLQDQLAQLKRNASSKEEVQNVNTKIAEQTQTLLKSNAVMSVKVDQLEERTQSTQGQAEQRSHRIDRMPQQLTQAQHDIEELRAAETARNAAAAAVASSPAAGTPQAPPARA